MTKTATQLILITPISPTTMWLRINQLSLLAQYITNDREKPFDILAGERVDGA
jgi:hypothetical protein